MRNWYHFEAKAATEAELNIYGDIGPAHDRDEAVSAQQFVADLRALPPTTRTIRVRINSLGGNVFEATAIANALRAERTERGRQIETIIDGVAASAASLVICAGQPRRIAESGLVMIHDPHGVFLGSAAELRQFADTLDSIRDAMVTTYRWVSPKSADELRAMMAATTWLDADEAIAAGFATDKVKAVTATASLDPRRVKALSVERPIPLRIAARLLPWTQPPADARPADAANVLAMCRVAGVDLEFAAALVKERPTAEGAKARIEAERQARADAKDRADAITALCKANKLPELAAGYIRGAMAVDDIKAQLLVLTAKLDCAEIDGGLDPNEGAPPRRTSLNTPEVYAARGTGARNKGEESHG